MAAVAVLAVAQALWSPLWLVALPAMLPWLGWAPWTGWLVVEEVDLALLAVAAGAYLRWAIAPEPQAHSVHASRLRAAWGWLLLALWSLSTLVASLRGVADAGGWAWGWYQGYREPLNALRLAKPTLALWLLLPLWWRIQGQTLSVPAGVWLSRGMVLGLAGASAICLWERVAYAGLLNFSSDYRTTGPFWEMHVGGAGLDLWLALTWPFALTAWLRARSTVSWALHALVLTAGAYAALTSFSRIVYLVLPLASGLVLWCVWRQQVPGRASQGQETVHVVNAEAGRSPAPALSWALWAGGLIAACVALAAMFPTAGYRGGLAVVANVGLLFWLTSQFGRQTLRFWSLAVLVALPMAAAATWLVPNLPKGPYLWFGACTALAGTLAWRAPNSVAGRTSAAALALCQLLATPVVARHWGGDPALGAALGWVVVACALGACLAWSGGLAAKPAAASAVQNMRWAAGGTGVLLVALMGVGVFTGGDYMRARIETSETDGGGRWQHWRDALARQRGLDERLLGVGLGRFLDRYALDASQADRPGDLRFLVHDGQPMVRMSGAPHPVGWGALLRLSQRIPRPEGRGWVLELDLRTPVKTRVMAEVCHKHLIYGGDCAARELAFEGHPGQVQRLRVVLEPETAWLPQPAWLMRDVVFSLGLENGGVPVDITQVALSDGQGRPLLRNTTFAEGGARWFFSSDRNHMPWHAKSLWVHVLFEQGVLGALVLGVWGVAAMGLLLTGVGRANALAPPLTAALLGFAGVGAIDSLLDMPRVATWALWVVAAAWLLRENHPAPR